MKVSVVPVNRPLSTISIVRTSILAASMGAASIAGVAAGQSSPLQQLQDAERLERIQQHQRRIMPEPISTATIDHWPALMNLDDDLAVYLDSLQEQYEDRCAKLDLVRRRIFELWPAAFEYNREQRAVQAVPNPQLEELYDEHGKLIEKLFDADLWLFNALRGQLSLEQEVILRGQQVERLMSFLEIPVDHRESRVDVPALVKMIELDEAERVSIQPLLATHMLDLAEMLSSTLPELHETAEMGRVKLLVGLGPHWELTTRDVARDEFSRELSVLDRPFESIWTWLAQHHRETLRRIQERLADAKAQTLFSLYLREVDPDLFEELDQMRDFMRLWTEALPQEEAIQDAIAEEATRIERHVRRITERFFDERDVVRARVTAIDAREDVAGTVSQLNEEIQRLSFTTERRDLLMRFTTTVLTQVESHLPPRAAEVRSFHAMQDARQDAEKWRARRLRERIATLIELGTRDHDDDPKDDADR